MRAAPGLLVVASLLLSGCTLVKEPEIREIAGKTDGYTPTAAFLKLNVRRPDGTVAMLDFDRRDWYTAKIAELVDVKQVPFVSAQAMPRDILNEYLASSVADPGTLAKLRYEDMGATAEERARMDDEHDALLARYVETAPVPPAALLPADPLP